MPTPFFEADTGFPQFNGEETNTEKIEKIENYLFILLEQLRYSLSSLDTSNFSESGLSEIGSIITEPFTVRLDSLGETVGEMASGEFTQIDINLGTLSSTIGTLNNTINDPDTGLVSSLSSLQQDVSGFHLAVKSGESGAYLTLASGYGDDEEVYGATPITFNLRVNDTGGNYSTLTLTAGGVDIATSGQITIGGNVVFKNNFAETFADKITSIDGGLIKTGLIEAERIDTGTLTGQTIISGDYKCRLDQSSSSGKLEFQEYFAMIEGQPIYTTFGTLEAFNGNTVPGQSDKGIMLKTDIERYALKLLGAGNVSIESSLGDIYINAGTEYQQAYGYSYGKVQINAYEQTPNDGNGVIIWGSLYVNGQLIGTRG